MKILGVYFREFSDEDYEIGILEDYGSYQIMNAGDFAYGQWKNSPWPKTYKSSGWIYIGKL